MEGDGRGRGALYSKQETRKGGVGVQTGLIQRLYPSIAVLGAGLESGRVSVLGQ